MDDFIRIQGARQHNLKNINVDIPKNKLTVITGLSGSGKSSLAFDTIYAEGQRRYVESLSSYARQFLGVMDKPDVDRITGLSPAIAINQKAASANPRSTVATVTEVYDYLRVLFARIGHPHCPNCGREVMRQSTDQITDQILQVLDAQTIGKKPTIFEILSPIVTDKRGEFSQLFESLRRDGYQTVIIDNKRYALTDDFLLIKTNKHTIILVIDKISATTDLLYDNDRRKQLRSRIAEAVELATKMSGGILYWEQDHDRDSRKLFSQNFACPVCNLSLPDIEPRTFSFNTPHGACPTCSGLGTVLSADPDAEERIPNLLRRYLETTNEGIRRRLAPFIITSTCPECNGVRLRKESRNVTILEQNIAEVTRLSSQRALEWMRALAATTAINETERRIASPLVHELSQRLEFLVSVGLDYLTLDRQAGSLSGGEAQRIRLASQIGTGLTGILYVLDEPTIGLHQRDNAKLIDILKRLRDLGNTILVVEHDQETIESADWVIEIGPGAGQGGGEVIAQGTPDEIKQNKNSLTGAYLSGRKTVKITEHEQDADFRYIYAQDTTKPKNTDSIKLYGASQHNLKSIDVQFPLRKFIVVTGVSGSGKSTLVHDTLYHALARRVAVSHRHQSGTFDQLIIPQEVKKVSLIDQSPIGRTPRSNPSTYTGIFSLIRELFASTREAKIRGYTAGRFSFNVPGGRCETCEGQGQIKVEMQFLPDIYVICEDCHGTRYGRETLEVTYKTKTIAQVLDMTVDEAVNMFTGIPALVGKLSMLQRVGLGYIKLGQSATTVSGGEAQRMKLSRELGKIRTDHTLYILDEPTTGLHFQDLAKLIQVLHDLVALDNTVIVVEHNLDVIKNAQWVIDLGPEGGESGGEVVVAGTPQQVAAHQRSYTGQYLKKILQ